MSEENEKKDEQAEEPVRRIPLKRHLWPDEVENRKLKNKVKRLRVIVIVTLVLSLGIGWGIGSLFPSRLLKRLRNNLSTGLGSSEDKIETILDVMENDWFFADQIDDLDTRLTDQAATGITTNKEDTHTEYMSAQESESFTQSINRDYVGIGVSFTNYDNVMMVREVFADSPAEKAGVQSGDVFVSVDGKSVDGLSSDDLKNLVQGKEGSEVTIVFARGSEQITCTMKRQKLTATAYGKAVNDRIYYLHMEQFGDGTPEEIRKYLSSVKNDTALILDLRDNGGGYLDSAVQIASMFLPENTVVLKREYADGTTTESKTKGGQIENIHNIVILVNENTASAAEVLTLALKEQRDDVTIVGTTTYGKGTVQITKSFDDGSALKYTTSKWLSPDGVWVNGRGITPDKEVELDDALTRTYAGMEDDGSYAYDSVGDAVADAESILKYFGYDVDRTDGYFDEKMQAALTQFESDHDLTADGVLSKEDYTALLSALSYDWSSSKAHDTQYAAALEVLNG